MAEYTVQDKLGFFRAAAGGGRRFIAPVQVGGRV